MVSVTGIGSTFVTSTGIGIAGIAGNGQADLFAGGADEDEAVVGVRGEGDHVAQWLSEAKKNSNPHMVIILVGNKADLEHKRAVR